eukprot:3893257-Rhodomonas_salina.1
MGGQERFTNSRKKALLNNVVPFLPLSVEDLAQVAAPMVLRTSYALSGTEPSSSTKTPPLDPPRTPQGIHICCPLYFIVPTQFLCADGY